MCELIIYILSKWSYVCIIYNKWKHDIFKTCDGKSADCIRVGVLINHEYSDPQGLISKHQHDIQLMMLVQNPAFRPPQH